MRLFWVAAGLLALCAPSSAIFATLIGISPTLAKAVMFGLGTLGPTFFTTGLVYFLGRHFGIREIRPKFRKPPPPPGNRFDYAAPQADSYAYYAPEESQYALQEAQAPYLEGRSAEPAVEAGAEAEEVSQEEAAPEPQFTHPRGRKVVSPICGIGRLSALDASWNPLRLLVLPWSVAMPVVV